MSALGQERPICDGRAMSALPPKADMPRRAVATRGEGLPGGFGKVYGAVVAVLEYFLFCSGIQQNWEGFHEQAHDDVDSCGTHAGNHGHWGQCAIRSIERGRHPRANQERDPV